MLGSHVLLLSAEWGYERLNPMPLQFTLWLWAGIVAGDARIEQVLSPSHLWVLNPLSNPSEFWILWILWISGLPGTRVFLQICFMDICGPFRHNHYDPCIFQLHTLWLFLQSAVELPASSISKACAYKILKINFKKTFMIPNPREKELKFVWNAVCNFSVLGKGNRNKIEEPVLYTLANGLERRIFKNPFWGRMKGFKRSHFLAKGKKDFSASAIY